MREPAASPVSRTAPFVPGKYQPALDGLRALSILAVLLYHDDYLLPGGYLGVDVFFVLSGFLITSLLYEEYGRSGRVDLRAFYLRRALRLFPALGALLLPAIAFVLVFPRAPQTPGLRSGIISSSLYVANWVSARHPRLLGPFNHTWSLCVEEQFYLLWPLMLLGLLAATRGRRRALPFVIGALALVAAFWRYALAARGATAWRLYVGTDTRADSLLVGCAVAIAMANGDLPRLLGGARAVLWLAIPGALWMARLLATTELEWPGYARGGYTAVAVATALVLMAVLTNPRAAATRLLAARPAVWLGRLSYSLYLWHMPVYTILRSDRPTFASLPLAVIRPLAALAVACLSYYVVELPFLRRKRALRAQAAPQI
jgi:peptidoglycan/LPS O-acetylase OafA/YrhL